MGDRSAIESARPATTLARPLAANPGTPKAGGRELDGRTWDEYPA